MLSSKKKKKERKKATIHSQTVSLIVAFSLIILFYYFLKILFIFRERRREGEKHQSVASHTPPTAHMASSPGVCPDRESKANLQFAVSAQSTELH